MACQRGRTRGQTPGPPPTAPAPLAPPPGGTSSAAAAAPATPSGVLSGQQTFWLEALLLLADPGAAAEEAAWLALFYGRELIRAAYRGPASYERWTSDFSGHWAGHLLDIKRAAEQAVQKGKSDE